jgi:hypothetical protein
MCKRQQAEDKERDDKKGKGGEARPIPAARRVMSGKGDPPVSREELLRRKSNFFTNPKHVMTLS